MVKNWKKFNKIKGDKDSLIKDHVTKVGKYTEIMATRAHRLFQKRVLQSDEQQKRKYN